MANKTMHHTVIGPDTFELVDQSARADVSDLKNALNYIPAEIYKGDFVVGQTISSSGVISVSDYGALTGYIPAIPGQTYYFPFIKDGNNIDIHCFVAEFREKNTSTFIIRKDADNKTIVVGNATNYIRILFTRNSSTGVAMTTQDIENYFTGRIGGNNIQIYEAVKSYNSKKWLIDDVAKKLDKQYGKNLFDKNAVTDGIYINTASGSTASNSAYYISDYIPVSAGLPYAMAYYTFTGAYALVYNSDYEIIGNWSSEYTGGVQVMPEGAAFVRFSGVKAYIDAQQFEQSDHSTSYDTFTDYFPVKVLKGKGSLSEPYSVYAENLSGRIAIDIPNAKYGFAIHFDAIVSSFDTTTIYDGIAVAYSSCQLEIDDTNLKVYSYAGGSKVAYGTYPHGLTIAEYLSVTINVTSTRTADIIVSTNGGTFVKKDAYWFGGQSKVAAETEGTLSQSNLYYVPYAADKNVWFFGDSYFDMWPYWAISWGFSNMLLDGYSGRQSSAALVSLNRYLLQRMPKRIVWCLGMNDVDTSTQINTSWKECAESVIDICRKNSIDLIFATIPNTPTRNHSFKNAFIKSSGYRYVDVNHAVGADVSSAWYTGLLSADNVHPTEEGQKVIANVMVGEIPVYKA